MGCNNVNINMFATAGLPGNAVAENGFVFRPWCQPHHLVAQDGFDNVAHGCRKFQGLGKDDFIVETNDDTALANALAAQRTSELCQLQCSRVGIDRLANFSAVVAADPVWCDCLVGYLETQMAAMRKRVTGPR